MSRGWSSGRRRGGRAPGWFGEVSERERAYALELAARDTAAWNAEFAGLSAGERAELVARAVSDDEQVAGSAGEDAQRGWSAQSAWLEQLCGQGVGVDPRVLLEVIAADLEPAPAADSAPAANAGPDGRRVSSSVVVRVAQLQLVRRLAGWLAARELALVAELCPPPAPEDGECSDGYLGQQALAEQVSVACRIGLSAAQSLIEDARVVGTVLQDSRAALSQGLISVGHVRVLVEETSVLEDDPAPCLEPAAAGPVLVRTAEDKRRQVQERVLARAGSQTVGQFRRSVRLAVCALDPQGEAQRRRLAGQGRDVYVRRVAGTGMGQLVDHDRSEVVAVLHAELTRRARLLQRARGGARAVRRDPQARLGACRADALAHALLGQLPARPGSHTDPTQTDQTTPAADPAALDPAALRGVEVQLVIDLATLRREADHPCLLGGEPIPAPLGRELAGQARAWRRMVTDPVTGHLLDYGRRVYLPAALTEFIRARDGRCTAPYCERPITGCQVDHRTPYPIGPSTAANTGALCRLHHALKTAGHVDIDDGRADGSMRWITGWSQHVHTSPRPYLDHPPEPPEPAAPAPEPAPGPAPAPQPPEPPPDDDEPIPF